MRRVGRDDVARADPLPTRRHRGALSARRPEDGLGLPLAHDLSDESGSPSDDLPPPLPAQIDVSDHQGIEEGVGPLMHRSFVARVRDAKLGAAALMARFAEEPNRAAPTALARFVVAVAQSGVVRRS